jgi:uncharacterized protein YlxP (DUF503 family)
MSLLIPFRTPRFEFFNMVVGTLEVRLLVRESRTLKDKRQVVRSILDKLRSGFNVSAAEVGTHEDVKVATLAFAAVGFETAAIQKVLQLITEALRKHPVAEYLGCETAVGSEVV